MMRIKQGATLLLTMTMYDVSGAPINLNAVAPSVVLATTTGTVVGPVTITATGVPGEALVLALASDTATWPVGILRGAVTVMASGIKIISNIFVLYIEQSVP